MNQHLQSGLSNASAVQIDFSITSIKPKPKHEVQIILWAANNDMSNG